MLEMVRLILTLLVFTICLHVEGSRKGRKELLDALSLIMSEASQASKVENYEERTADVDLDKSEHEVSLDFQEFLILILEDFEPH